jgi:hypothetical protein
MMEKQDLTPEQRYAYGIGARDMCDTFAVAYSKEMKFDSAIAAIGRWTNEVLRPWVEGDVEVIGHPTTPEGYPIPPLMRLPKEDE